MPNKKKKKPGRPKKIFIPKPKAKKDGPGRPKKIPLSPEPRKGMRGFFACNILQAPKKDNIILLLFVASLFLFIFSIYVTVLKSQRSAELQSQNTEITSPVAQDSTQIPNVQTGNIPYQQTILATGEETAVVSTDQEKIDLLKSFYDALNAKDITTLYQLADKNLKATNTFQTYYSKNRLTIFLGGVQGTVGLQNIQIQPAASNTSNAQQVTYTLQYILKDGQAFAEDRSIVLIKRGEEYKIGKIMCETPGCSQMPFFNPAKYGIK
ncbi:MAG: hypothetical protein WC875_04840 [Candidatus Absconditabacterales bacterium]